MTATPTRFRLRDLPLPARVVIACFLATVGLGYLSALVQLHFQHAPPGDLLPGAREVERTYFGSRDPPASRVEQLLEAATGPMNGAGTMRRAFAEQSRDWETVTRGRTPEQLGQLVREREGERLALLGWVRSGADREAYDRDDYPLGMALLDQAITESFLVPDPHTGKPATPKRVRIRSLVAERCVSCHGEPGREEEGTARLVPLDTYERLKPHCEVQAVRSMPLPKLAQTTHVHLLGFALLFGLTGLAFSFTRYPQGVQLLVGPLPLVAQGVEIGCWWLGRFDPLFTPAVLVAGGVVAVSLTVQILGTCWDLFGRWGRAVLLFLLLLAVGGGVLTKVFVVDPQLERERREVGAAVR